jgi:uncharacterized protein (TIGR02246 family)
MTDPSPAAIAAAFAAKWESAWNDQGAAATAQLYTPDAMLVGASIGSGQAEIARLLGLLYAQGWTRITIAVKDARAVGSVVLAACTFTAQGSGPSAGKVLHGKSSHVLARIGDTWLSAMHTAA